MGKAFHLAGLLLLASTFPSWAQWDFRDSLAVSGVRVSAIDGTLDGARNINIRGLNSLRGNNNPLIVVDGCIVGISAMENLEAFFQYGENSYTNAFNLTGNINPQDIESIEVLKNVSATALYGSKGADGVILITTKSGKKDRLTVDWKSNLGVSFANAGSTRAALSHDHWLGVSALNDRASYAVSAHLRQVNQIVPGAPTTRGGIRTNFETKTNNILWFGLNSAITAGSIDTPLTAAWYGDPFNGLHALSDDYDDSAKDYHTTNSLYLAVNPLPGLQWKTTVGLDFAYTTRYIWYGDGTPFGAAYNGAASIVTSKTLNYNGESKLSYKVFLAKKHHLEANAAAVIEGNWDKFSTMNGTDFWTHALRAKGLSMAGSKAIIRDFNYRFFQWGAYLTLDYSFADYAGVNLLARTSSTPRYDDGIPAVFPGAEAWFDLKNTLLQGVSQISALKLSTGWGKGGKNVFVPYQMLSQFTTGDYPEVAYDIAHYYEALNRRVSSEWNISLSGSFLGQRLWAQLGYYIKETSDDIDLYTFGGPDKNGIVWVEKPRETVYSQNAGLGNAGVEWTLGGQPLRNDRWSLRAETFGCYNVNRILSVNASDRLGREVGSGVLANVNVLGFPAGSLYGYELNADGSYKDQTGDGKISLVDRSIIGNTQPKVYGGLRSTLTYKDISIEAQVSGAAGHQLLNMNRMLEDGETTVSARYVEKADYLRLDRLALSWQMRKGISLTLQAYNLLTLTGYSGWNPDVNSFGNSNLSTGFDYGSYPLAKTVMAGIQMNF